MYMLIRAVGLRHWSNVAVRSVYTSAVKNHVYNYDDYKPGPRPKTKEEIEAAAKKYNLLPSEYESYPDEDGLGYGDYPKLPYVGDERKDPFYPWDIPRLRRNFGEPLHADIDQLIQERLNAGPPPRLTDWWHIRNFIILMVVISSLYWLLEPYPLFRPHMEKQYPSPGTVHYTFEPLNS